MARCVNIYALTVAFASLIFTLLVLIMAMLNGGEVTVSVNRWSEGYLEIALLAAGAVVFPSILLDALRKANTGGTESQDITRDE